ncbi:hypothetical protein [Kitasatospora camelliae]|uniref:LppP/LprE lipoprotein n=1 Tax=Kitasatospora camelliae TaxID=3156397 RepID=A0AAU8JZK3_9ACTN
MAVTAASVLLLTACEPDGSSDAAGGATAAATTAPTGAPQPTGTAAASPSAKPSAAKSTAGDAPGRECTTPKPAAGHKIAYPVRQPSKDSLYWKDTRFVCDAAGGHYEPTGAEQHPLVFSVDATGELVAPGGRKQKVEYLGQLWQHIGDCLAGGDKQHPCSPYPAYDVTLDAQGQIAAISEIPHA